MDKNAHLRRAHAGTRFTGPGANRLSTVIGLDVLAQGTRSRYAAGPKAAPDRMVAKADTLTNG